MMKKIAVLGSGMGGLACAHYIARAGGRAIVLEPSGALGPSAPPIVHDGMRIERFWAPLQQTDTALCGLLAQLGGLGRIAWRRTVSGIGVDGAFHPASSTADLMRSLRLAELSRRERLLARAGLAYLTQLKCHPHDLRDLCAADWLPRVLGRRAYESYCRPFLEARFGEYGENVPADWVFRRIKAYATRHEVVGFLRGGGGWLGARLRRSIEARGGEVRLHAAITAVETHPRGCRVEVDGRELEVDAVVCALPPARLAKLARGRLASALPDLDVPYQGVVSVLIVLARRLGRYYQTTFLDPDAPLRRTTEATHVVPAELVDGRHFLYVRDPCGPHTERFKQPDGAVCRRVIGALQQSFPGFSAREIEAVHVSRDEAAEPAPVPRNLRRRLPSSIEGRVFLCSPAAGPPRRANWDGDVMFARDTAAAIGVRTARTRYGWHTAS